MIVRPEHFEFDRDKSRELTELARDRKLSGEQRDLVNDATNDQPFFSEAASHCFYCGEKLTIPAVMWNGRDGGSADAAEIWLHPKCAEQLCARLNRDVNELKVGRELANEKFLAWKREHPFR